MTRRGWSGWLVLPVVLAALVRTEGAAAAVKQGGTLTIVRPADAASLDPNLETQAPGAWVYYNIVEPLVVLDEQSQPQPKLAATWQVLSPTRVRFKLRQGVKFHDGTPLNAEAVRFTFERADKSKPQARWASLAGPIAGAEVVDEHTVDIVTKEPYGPLLRSLAMVFCGIVSPTAVKMHGEEFGRHPVGTGPFKFVEWRSNTHIILQRNDDYWGEKAHLDRVMFRVIPEEGARMIALRTGDADMVLQPAPAELASLRKDPKFTVHDVVGGRVVYFGMNVSKPPMNEVRLRQAIFHAVNTEAMLANILEGAAVRPRGYLAPDVFGFKDMKLDQLYPYDKAKAKALLAAAGYTPGSDGIVQKNGERLSLGHLSTRGRYLKDGEITEALQAQLKEVGVEVKLHFLETATVATQLRAAKLDYHLFTVGWATVSMDADFSLYAQFHSKQIPPTGWNRQRYSHPRVDTLVEEARRTIDQAKRAQLYGEVQDILAKEPPWVPVYNSREIAVTRAFVKGFQMQSMEYNLPLWTVWLEK